MLERTNVLFQPNYVDGEQNGSILTVAQLFLMFSCKISHKGGTVKEEHLAEQLPPWRSKPD